MSDLALSGAMVIVFGGLLLVSLRKLARKNRPVAGPAGLLAQDLELLVAAGHGEIDPSRYRVLSAEMIAEIAATHRLRFDEQISTQRSARLRFSVVPTAIEEEDDDR